MDFRFSPHEQAFKQDVQDFIKKEWPKEPASDTDDMEEESRQSHLRGRAFAKKLAKKGWLAMAWPKQYGGGGASHIEQLIYHEEMSYRGAHIDTPISMGLSWVGPSLLLYGTEEQKKTFIPKILNAEEGFCTFYSEPGAGSDLAAMQTRAVADGDDFVVNGQKIWTTGAHHAEWGWLAARTDPTVPKHKGISMFLVDMKTPGLTVKPLVNMAHVHSFNEDFFDNVRIPKQNLVGELNRGWYLLAVALDFERSGVGTFAGHTRNLEQLLDFARNTKSNGGRLSDNPALRAKLAELKVEIEAGRFLAYRIAWMQSKGLVPNKEASISKLFGSELGQRLYKAGMEMVGLYGQLDRGSKWAPLKGAIERGYLSSVSATIAAGTSEIQRNIIAQRGLGLPR